MTNKLFITFLFILSFSLNADTYNEALKYDAKGDYKTALKLFNEYFDNNINDINQDGVIEKLIYSSTLLPTIEESMDYMLHYVKYMKNPNSRFRIYNKIAEIYELIGNIYDAGIYYEKASYTMVDYIDYDSLINSIDMLVELGYYEISTDKLHEILLAEVDTNIKDRCNLLLCRISKILNQNSIATEYINEVKQESVKKEFYKHELGLNNSLGSMSSDNFQKRLIYSPYHKLKTPTDYIGLVSELETVPNIKHRLEDEKEILIGTYNKKEDAAGIINIANQMGLPWFFDKNGEGFTLYIFSKDREKSIDALKKLGIEVN